MKKRKKHSITNEIRKLKDHVENSLEHKENSWLKVMEIVGDIVKDVIKARAEIVEVKERLEKLEDNN